MSNYNYGLEPGIARRSGSSKLRFVTIFLIISAATSGVLWYFWPEQAEERKQDNTPAEKISPDTPAVKPEQSTPAPPLSEKDQRPVVSAPPVVRNKGEAVAAPPVKKDTEAVDPTDPQLPPKGVITPADMSGKDLPVIAADAPLDPAKEELLKKAQELFLRGKYSESELLAEKALEQIKENTPFYRKAWLLLSALRVKSLYEKTGSRWSVSYRIKPGDSLSSIASRYRTTVELIRKRNNISGSRIYVGRSLWLTPGDWRISVSKSARLLKVYHSGKDKKETVWGVWEVGIGRMGKTPSAEFAISSRVRHPDWYLPDGRVFKYGEPENQLGEYFLKLAPVNAPGRPLLGYGIHGAKDESAVGRSLSNGCIRMKNADVEAIFFLVPSGTRVSISEK